MTISNLEEIKCPQGHLFEASLLSAISISDNPELKEVLIAGEINLVSCPECGEMFHAECFILYHDNKNELIAFVYPLSFRDQSKQCKVKMNREFKLALNDFEEKQKIKYGPTLFFGVENLILLLRTEQDIEDEESILKYIAPSLSLDVVKIAPSLARELKIPKIIPIPKCEKNLNLKSLISGLKILVKYNSNLLHYVSFLERVSKGKMIIAKLKK
jgi:hypothetical protein